MTVDHDDQWEVANTEDKSLEVFEDSIGLRAESVITDPKVMLAAREGRLKGWSFGMLNVKDEIEERTNQLPIRHVNELDLDHITLAIKKEPVYSATSVEMRAEDDIDKLEMRAFDTNVEVSVIESKHQISYETYEQKLNTIRKGKKDVKKIV